MSGDVLPQTTSGTLGRLGRLHALRERRAQRALRDQRQALQLAEALLAERLASVNTLKVERAGLQQHLTASGARMRGDALQAIETRRRWLAYELERAMYQLDQAERALSDAHDAQRTLEAAWYRCHERLEQSTQWQRDARHKRVQRLVNREGDT